MGSRGWNRTLLRAVGLGALLIGLGVSGCQGDDRNGRISGSGFIEGTEVHIASEVAGRVVEITVDEGDPVVQGQVVLRLDDALLRAERTKALAAVAAAEANLARLEAGTRPEEITAARAALSQAEAQRDAALRAVESARRAIENPQDLDLEIAQAEMQVALAEQDVEMARADLAEAELLYNVYRQQGGDAERTAALQVEAARAALEGAQARVEGARRYLETLQAMRANPLTLLAQLHAAEGQLEAAEAGVEKARAALEEAEAGPTPEELAVARAQLRQARAMLALVDARVAQLTLTSPITGVVTSRNVHVGETASPGVPLLTVAKLDEVRLVLYVPEDRIGRVRVGQRVEVRVDSFPGRVFVGRVATIAGEAEFTPRNVQTEEERVNLVFAVKVVIPNPDHALKPGMPADAEIVVH